MQVWPESAIADLVRVRTEREVVMGRFCSIAVVALFAGAVAMPNAASAQFTEDSRRLGFHLGMSGVGSAAAIGVQGEIAYNDRISIGAWIDTWSYGESYAILGSTTSWDTRYVSFAGTGAYHFPVESNPRLDPFLGVAVGYFVVSSSASGSSGATYTGSGSRLFLGGHGGVRYFFKPNMAGVALLGVGASYLTVGMDFGLGGS